MKERGLAPLEPAAGSASPAMPASITDLARPPEYLLARTGNGHGHAESGTGGNGHGDTGHAESGTPPSRRERVAPVAAAEGPPGPPGLPLILESLLMVAEEPPTIAALARALEAPPDAVEAALDVLIAAGRERGVRVQRQGATVQLVTAAEAAPYVERFLGIDRPGRLSRAALETLAIIAYQQPVTRLHVDAVRGVNSDGALQTLRQRDLIEPVGQLDAPGRPYVYGTTFRFLEHFGLDRPDQLPPLPALPCPARQGILPLDAAPTEADPLPAHGDALAAEAEEAAAAEMAGAATPAAEAAARVS